MSPSYGHAYLTSYGWAGSGTGLRKGAIDKPLAIPPKKNLSGLGKDRDEAFPFWDHLFAAASKAITIKVSSDDEDADETEDPTSVPLHRTTTGILSNRRPVSGTPASTSGSTTPNPVIATSHADSGTTPSRPSLLAIAKREAAKRGLYARFFRGPVLGPDNDHPHADAPSRSAPSSPSPSPPPSSEASESKSKSTAVSAPALERVGDRDDVARETTKNKKRRSKDDGETKEERRERKRLKRERKAERMLAREKAMENNDRKARKQRDKETRSKEDGTSSRSKKARKHARKSVAGSEEPAKCTRKELEEGLAPMNGGQQNTSHKSPNGVDITDAFNVVLTTKKKKGKRKDTHSRHFSYVAVA